MNVPSPAAVRRMIQELSLTTVTLPRRILASLSVFGKPQVRQVVMRRVR